METDLPHMWEIVELSEAMDAIIDYRGKSPKKSRQGIPLITAKIVKNGRIDTPNEFIEPSEYDSWMRRGLPQPGDVLITTEAPLGEAAQLGDTRVALAQRLIALRGKRGYLDNTFLKYLLLSEYVQEQLRARSSGTTVLGIRQSELRKVRLSLPPYREQEAIARVLGSLDSKIELNRRMNRTLEAAARAIFKAWFIDFEPVKARVAGATSFRGIPQTAFDQLPASFNSATPESIPAGWSHKPIGDLVQVVGGSTPSTKNLDYWRGGAHPFCTPKDMSKLSSLVLLDTERHITEAGVNKISSGKLPVGTVLLSSRAPIGYVALAETSVSINQGIIAMLTGDMPAEYVLFWVLTNMDMIESRAGGSTFAEIGRRNFSAIHALRPDDDTLGAFGALAKPIFDMIASNERESRTLAAIRDALLPKLVSGQIRVPGVEDVGDGH